VVVAVASCRLTRSALGLARLAARSPLDGMEARVSCRSVEALRT